MTITLLERSQGLDRHDTKNRLIVDGQDELSVLDSAALTITHGWK